MDRQCSVAAKKYTFLFWLLYCKQNKGLTLTKEKKKVNKGRQLYSVPTPYVAKFVCCLFQVRSRLIDSVKLLRSVSS